jgi:hypothetical protein
MRHWQFQGRTLTQHASIAILHWANTFVKHTYRLIAIKTQYGTDAIEIFSNHVSTTNQNV